MTLERKKMKIGIDIDGVIAEVTAPIMKEFGEKKTIEDVVHWNYISDLIGKKNFWIGYFKVWQEGKVIPLKENIKSIIAFYKLKNQLDFISRTLEIDFISCRDKKIRKCTLKFLKKNGLDKIGKLILVKQQKEKFELGYDFIIDDNNRYIPRKEESKLCLITMPWNKDFDEEPLEKVNRFNNVGEALAHIDYFEK
jgi:uncharacterized HAD superfamily protein